jgi:hypothetical protein
MLPIGSNEREFEVPGFVGECISCGPQALRNAVARYSFGTYAGFFGLLKRVEIYGTCTKCEDEVLIPEAEVPQSVREQIPFMHRKGILILPIVIVIVIVIAAIAGAF